MKIRLMEEVQHGKKAAIAEETLRKKMKKDPYYVQFQNRWGQ